MNDGLDSGDGLTPLDPDEAAGLLVPWISNRGELNIVEQENIMEAERWLINHRQSEIVSVDFMRLLHRRMFDQVWKWAGEFRMTEKNIGIDPREISVQMRLLCDDARFQIEQRTYEADEISYRLHHRLVFIHPYPNGNGRFARLMTDVLLEQKLNRPRFTWGRTELQPEGPVRTEYISALRAADGGNLDPLRKFVRSGGEY